RRGLRLYDVSYYAPGREAPLVKRANLRIKPGEAIGLTGASAAGKSTFARLVIGNLEPDRGEILLGGVDIGHPDRALLGPHLGYLPQSVELFDGTVRENIARMTMGDLEAVLEAARLTGVHDMVADMPAEYDTPIGDGGAILSGGQRQRIALARAVYGDPKLVVLDEPDASLDADGRRALADTVDALKARGSMVLLISHNPDSLASVDRLYELADGRLTLVDSAEVVEQRRLAAGGDGRSLRLVDMKSHE
ncbi:MAG: ATP-binding cassette domain-containing protein, partial [Caulobacterales bacterium]|nr:ATP-binding cassette domain-containing protein [Caulobacterales bacterium]